MVVCEHPMAQNFPFMVPGFSDESPFLEITLFNACDYLH